MLKQVLIVLSMIVLMQPVAHASEASALRQPENQSPVIRPGLQKSLANATGCQWTYYPISGGQLQPEQLLYNDPDNTPVSGLSLGNPFKSNATSAASLATTGSTDFDGDGKTDVFRTWPRADGNLQWQYSSGGTGAWQDLAYASSALPAAVLQFGELDGDTHTDVFANSYSFPNYQWVYSPSGTNSFVLLHTTPNYADRLALGDFNGDGKTDVFTAIPSTVHSGTEQWAYYPGGNGSLGSPMNLAYAGTDVSLLRFGDFNGDGKTDVFAATQQADGSTQWLYSSGGAASFTDLITTTVPYAELQFGDFNGDGKTDVLAALPQADGGLQVTYWPGGLGAGVSLGHIAAPAPALRVGDFNGDGTDDLMALRCGMAGPLAFGPRQILANSGYSTFYHILAGDVNGDGRPALILVATCQNLNAFGICATHHLQLGAVLGTPAHTYTLVAPQQLGADNLDFTDSKALQGDFDGDGKTDLALISATGTTLTIYVAHSNGDGTFTLGSPQTFGGENWGDFNPIVGDFNGDGTADLAFTTVCNTVALSAGSCTNGDSNSVYVATSTGAGGFNLGARQDLGLAAGWSSYYAFAGDFNGDGKTDLVFNSTCQKKNTSDSTCTLGDANLVYTALSNGLGGFTLSAKQTYGSLGWSDYHNTADVVGDVNGDGRSDLVWSSGYQSAAKTYNNLVVAALANADGTFQLGSFQNFGSDWTGYVALADLNHDGKADLVWNNTPLGDTDVDTYAAATSSGDGMFDSLGPGALYTGPGYFQIPETNAGNRLPTGLTVVSGNQNPISNALVVVNGGLPTATPTATVTPTRTPTTTITPTRTQPPTATRTPTVTLAPTNSPTSTNIPSATSTVIRTATPTTTVTPSFTATPTATPTRTVTGTPTVALTATISPTPMAPFTSTSTRTSTITPSVTETPTAPPMPSPTSTRSATGTQTPTAPTTLTPTETPLDTATPRSTPTPRETPTETPKGVGTLTPAVTQVVTPTPTPIRCVGDCDGSGDVTVNELITLVNIALGTASSCLNGIPSGAAVDITLIVKAVGYALTNCPAL